MRVLSDLSIWNFYSFILFHRDDAVEHSNTQNVTDLPHREFRAVAYLQLLSLVVLLHE